MEDTKTVQQTDIQGVYVLERPTFTDERGFFGEVFRASELEDVLGEKFRIVQQNHSRSKKLTLRGIHVAPWRKLVYVPHGLVQQVVVDLDTDSPTFGKYVSVLLGEGHRQAVFVPRGFGNAYLVLSNDADYMYLVDEQWRADSEYGLSWDDPQIDIEWKLEGREPVLSERDKEGLLLKDKFPETKNG